MLTRVVLALSLIACSKSEEHARPAPPPAPVEPVKPKLAAAWLGKTPAKAPGDLGKLVAGMPLADAAKLVPWVAPSGQALADVADTTLAVQKTRDGKGVGDLLAVFDKPRRRRGHLIDTLRRAVVTHSRRRLHADSAAAPAARQRARGPLALRGRRSTPR